MQGLVRLLESPVFAFTCPALLDSMDCSPPDSSVHGLFQARILEWVAVSFSRESSPPRDGDISCVASIGRQILYHFCHLDSSKALPPPEMQNHGEFAKERWTDACASFSPRF